MAKAKRNIRLKTRRRGTLDEEGTTDYRLQMGKGLKFK